MAELPKYPMELQETQAGLLVHFAGLEGANFTEFDIALPEFSSPTAKAKFLRDCDVRLDIACGNTNHDGLANFMYDVAPAEADSPIDLIAARKIVGVCVSCAVVNCPLVGVKATPEQTVQLPKPSSSSKLLPAKLRAAQ